MNGTMVVPNSARALNLPEDWSSLCMSAFMFPLPHFIPTRIIPSDGSTPYLTWPVCMELQVVSFKPKLVFATWSSKVAALASFGSKNTILRSILMKRFQADKEKIAKFTFRVTWTYIAGQCTLAILAKACVPIDLVYPFLGPPLFAEKCVWGGITITFGPACPGSPALHLSGFFKMGLRCGLDLWIMEIIIGVLELGVSCGIAWVWKGWCWWVRANEGPNRRRFWDRRRRNTRKCDGNRVCDFYAKGWIRVKLLIVEAVIDMIWWAKCKRLESTLTIMVKRIWWWSMDWFAAYQKAIWQKQF